MNRSLLKYIELRTHAGEKLVGADDKLLFLTFQHHRRFARSERRAPLNFVCFAFECYLHSRLKPFQPQVISLRLDLFHGLFHNISPSELKP